MREPIGTALTALALLFAAQGSGGAPELPDTVRSGQVEMRIVLSSPVILLRRGCTKGPYTRSIVVKGTGQAQLRVQIRGEPACPPEVTDFAISAAESLEMLNGLLDLHFHRLDNEYSGRELYVTTGPETLQRRTTLCSDCVDRITVSLELGNSEHSVAYGNGASIPGLSEWASRWLAELEARAELARLETSE